MYKETIVHWVGAIILIFVVASAIVALVFVNSQKEHIPSPEEIYAKKCADLGKNVKTRTGYDNGIHVQEFSCEGGQ